MRRWPRRTTTFALTGAVDCPVVLSVDRVTGYGLRWPGGSTVVAGNHGVRELGIALSPVGVPLMVLNQVTASSGGRSSGSWAG